MPVLTELRDIGRDYVTHRDLLWQLVLRDLRVRYKQAVMGFLWALFMPALLVLAGLLVRHAVTGSIAPGARLHDAGGVAVRGVLWATFSAAVTFGTASLVGDAALISKIYFPREVLPVAAVVSNALDGAVGGLVLVCAIPWLGGRVGPGLLWVPVLLLLFFLLVIGVALTLSAANLLFRDVKYIVQALLTVGVLFTPVFYVPSELGSLGARLIRFNPLTPLLQGMTLAVFESHNLARPLVSDGVVVWSPWMLAYATTMAIGGVLLASVAFHRAEDLFAERL
jgi:ABC-type polysaccharide/polyol phosphate export permease